jgi:2-polyprenyl-3-methyl-5-hydroxy-6-metoxy-1,4-benzoquinol methylase
VAIGDYYRHSTPNKIKSIIAYIFGTLDLHTHIRLKPVLKYMKDNIKKGSELKIIEVGCGAGTVAFELPKIADIREVSYIGVDLNADAINLADKMARALNIDDHVKFVCADATTYAFENEANCFDTVLLIDFLEHVRNPADILRSLMPKLKEKGIFVVSVPTPYYRRVFGKEFHERVGHVVDGFTLQELKSLFDEIGAMMIYHKYSTGLISIIGCALYYRFLCDKRYISVLKGLLLYPFRFLDFYNSERVSCSLFAVFKLNGTTVRNES